MFNKIMSNVIHGENSFCSLCFNIDIKIVSDKINVLIDETEKKIALCDILRSVFGNEVQEYVSTFGNICEGCLEMTVGIYTYIQICHSNAQSLIQAIDRLNNTLNSSKESTNTSKSLFVSLNLKTKTSELIFVEENIESVTKALKQYNLLKALKIQNGPIKKKLTKLNKDVPVKLSDVILDLNDELPRCKKCLKTYPSVYNVKAHFLRVHAPKDYKCPKCPKAFSSANLVAYHVSSEHAEIICGECGKTFDRKSSFIRHQISHYLQLVCPDCGRIYKSTITYKNHILSALCQKECRANPVNAQFTCDFCGKKYTQKTSLRVHIKHAHGNYKSHVCKWCGKGFWAQSRLKAHIVKHTKEKKFSCPVCQGKFVTKESLLYHTRLHTGEKPYRCSQCDCAFISSSRRAYHMKAYHQEGMIECETCNCKFTSSLYLNKHKKTCKEHQNRQKLIDESDLSINTDNNLKKERYL